MKKIILFAILFISLNVSAQLPKWILGSSQQTAGGSFYSAGPGNLHFFETDFTGASPVVTPRVTGASINNIVSVGTQDVIDDALDASGNIQFYLFCAARVPYNDFSSVVPDTIYFAAYNPATGKDEVFGKVAAADKVSSVIEHALCPRPGFPGQYYFIYKTHYGSNTYDDIRYVLVNGVAKTVGTPITFVSSEKTGEGFTLSQHDCVNDRYWLFTTRLESGTGYVTLRRTEITASGLTGTTDVYTINLTNNTAATVMTALEMSSQGNILAVTLFSYSSNKAVSLLDFDVSTGIVNNERYYTSSPGYPIVTCEFSPDGSQLYFMQGGGSLFPNAVYKCPVISAGSYTFGSAELISSISISGSLAMELAYDGKIYVNKGHNASTYYCITNPNSPTPTVITMPSPFFGTSTYRIGDAFPDQIDGISTGVFSPSISASATTICPGQSATLSGSGGGTYQWSGGSTSTSPVITVSPAVTTTYYLQVMSGGCTGTDSVTVTVAPAPVSAISGTTTICDGTMTTLTASGGPSFQWGGGSSSTSSTITVAPSTNTLYYVTSSNGSCTGPADSVMVYVLPITTVAFSGPDSICAGQSVSLTATASAPSTYQWAGGSTATTPSITVSPASTTVYYVTADNGSCPGTDSVTVVVTPVPVSTISGTTTICEGSSTTLTAAGGSSFQWSGGSSSTSSSITVSPTDTTLYYVIGSNGSCAGIADSVFVYVLPTTAVTITGADTICSGQSILLTATATPVATYQWGGGSTATTPSITVSPASTTVYYVTASAGSCPGSDSATVFVQPAGAIDFENYYNDCLNAEQFSPLSSSSPVLWHFGDGTSSAIASPSHAYPAGSYTVTLITNPGTLCEDSVSHTIVVEPVIIESLVIPNVFTPNNDGTNDVLRFSGLNPCKEYTLTIYNRWGQKVFETATPRSVFWNGENGTKKEVIEGTYFYLLVPADAKADDVIRGSVSLIR